MTVPMSESLSEMISESKPLESTPGVPVAEVLRVAELGWLGLQDLLAGLGLRLHRVADDAEIPSSYWGESEAGVQGCQLYARGDTPVHSVLHTAGHVLCMDAARRAALDRDCGGDDTEEVAVCYLQCLLADELPGFGRARMWADMDAWGYAFRLGGAARWFAEDAGDARDWLLRHGLLTAQGGADLAALRARIGGPVSGV